MKVSTKSRGFRVTPEIAIKFIKISVFLTCMWPPQGDESKILFKLFMYISIFLSIGLFIPLVFSVINFFDNLLIVLKSTICMAAILNFVTKLVIVRTYHKEFKKVESAMSEFMLKASDSKKLILQKYIDKCWKFQFIMICSYYLGATGIILGPLVLPQKFPTDAIYPFSVENLIVSRIVYLHQSFVAYQCAAGMVLDGQAALFIWYLNAKFEILISESKRVINHEDMSWYIRKHQDILSFADELIPLVRILAFTTVSTTKILIITSGFFLISDESLPVKIQFAIVGICSTMNTYLYSWSSDHLINNSGSAMSDELFGIFWRYSLKMKKMCLLIIHRTHQPVVINIPGLLDTLSNEYYSSFLSTAFSSFATIRVIINNSE